MSKGVYKKIPVDGIKGFFKINGKEDSWNIIDFSEKGDILKQTDVLDNIPSTEISRLIMVYY